MSVWNVYIEESGGWVADGTIKRPNEDLSTPIESTMEVVTLEDGSEGVIIPETKYRKS